MDLEHEKRLADVENKAKSNTRRIEKIEKQTEAINNIATAVQVMATKQAAIAETLERLDNTVAITLLKRQTTSSQVLVFRRGGE